MKSVEMIVLCGNCCFLNRGRDLIPELRTKTCAKSVFPEGDLGTPRKASPAQPFFIPFPQLTTDGYLDTIELIKVDNKRFSVGLPHLRL